MRTTKRQSANFITANVRRFILLADLEHGKKENKNFREEKSLNHKI